MSDFSQNQKLFAAALAQSTGLDPNTVKAWMIAEEPMGAQSGYKGTQDWLNVGITDSGPRGAGNNVWSDPVSAGKATGNWIKGTWADPGFGTASPGIQSILKTVGQSPQAQLAAIASSGWASSGYGGASRLQSLLSQVSGVGLPNVPSGGGPVSGVSPIPAPNFGSAPTAPADTGPNIFDTLAGLESAREKVVGDTGSAVEKGWQALSSFLTGKQQSEAAQKQQPTVNIVGKGLDPTTQGAPHAVVSAKGVGNYDGKPVANWIIPILQWATAHGWKGSVNSGYRSDAEQTAIYKSGVRPAAVPKSMGGQGSNHEGSVFPLGAVDVTDAAQLSEILKRSPYASVLIWAGNKDPVHFSHPHNGGY